MVSSQSNIDPTVVDATHRGLIESYAGTSLKDASKEEIEFLVSQSKSAGNMLFKDKKYKEAIKMYSQAIAGNEHDHVLFSNRSASYLAIGLLEQALWDAKKSVTLNPNWAKGYYRLGCALESLNDWESAYSSFSKALEIMPEDKDIMEKEFNARKRLEEDVAAMNAAAAVERHNLVLKLRDARHEDQKLTMLNQFKQSMTAPDWELDDLEWRPTWLPRLRTMAVDARDWIESDPKKNGLLSYLYALSDIAAPKSCIKILEDDDRHSWYLGCFQECFKCPKRALVVGAGGGMLGMLAAQAGCQRVTQVERSRMLYRMAKQIIESNKDKDYTKDVNLVSGILESVRVELTEVQDLKQETSLQYSLPKESQIKDYYFMEQPAEVLITDLIDHTVLGLHLLPAVDYSAKYLLTPGAQVIPGTVKIMAQIIELKLDDIAGFDLSAMDCYRWYPGDEKFDAQNNPYKPLSDPFVAVEINLTKRVELVQSGGGACKDELWEVDEDINVLVTETGQWNAVLFWFELGMDHGPNSVKLTNHHKSDCNRVNGSSWGQAVQYLDDRQVSQGQELLVRVQQDKSQIIFSSTPPQCRMHHAIVPRWHYDMILDAERNAAYNTAIQKAVAAKKSFKSGSKVHCLDMGAGSGLLSMMAARAGADYTYAAEMNAHMCDVAEECTIMNGFLDKILVLDRDVRRMDVLRKSDGTAPELERPVDIAIFEVFDSGLIGEGVLHILAAAKAKLLMPDASLVPCRAEVYAQPIQMRLSNSHGLDIQQANRWRWRSDYEGVELGRNKDHWVPLAEPSKVFSFDFYDVQQCAMDNQNILTFDITTEGVCNAVAMWFKLHLDDEISLSTSPYEEKGPTWQQAVQYIKEVKLEKGDQIQVQATHDTYSISYKLVEDKNVLEKMTSVPLYDEQWKTSFDSLESFNSQIVKSCVQNPLEYRFVAQTSIQFAARPHDFGLDASSSSEFCSRFMG